MVGFWIDFLIVLTGCVDSLDVECEESEESMMMPRFLDSATGRVELHFIKLKKYWWRSRF